MRRLIIGVLLFVAVMIGNAFATRLLSDRAEKRLAIEHVKALVRDPKTVSIATQIIVRRSPDRYGNIALAVCGFVTGQNVYDPEKREQRFVVEEYEQVDTRPLAAYLENKPQFVSAIIESDDLRIAVPAPKEQKLVDSRFESNFWNRSCVDDSNPWASHSGLKSPRAD